MLEKYKNSPKFKNQYGIEVPIFMIHIDRDLYDISWDIAEEKRKQGDRRSYIDFAIELYKEKYGEEHEANQCKSEKDVITMHRKNVYNHIKKIVHKRGKGDAIDIYDNKHDFDYTGAYIKILRNKTGEIDMEESEVQIYSVNKFCENDFENNFIPLNEFKLISDKLSEILKREETTN